MKIHIEHGELMPCNRPFEGHSLVNQSSLELSALDTGLMKEVDTSWLPQAAERYDISPKLSDYVLLSAPVMILGAPNRNGVVFKERSMMAVSPSHNMPRYQTWVGCPTHYEHCLTPDKDPKGVILGAHVQTLSKYVGNPKALFLLHAFDRRKDPKLANEIMSLNRPYVSMGASVTHYACTACGVQVIPNTPERCSHASKNAPKVTIDKAGVLHCAECVDFYGHESSSVYIPAYAYAGGSLIT